MASKHRLPTIHSILWRFPEDEERSKRYEATWSIFCDYACALPTVPELDGIAPEKPSENPANRLDQSKGLDPVRGRPLHRGR
ncbi:hypothetical protein R0381_000112 [Jeongeupia wiesaeckerbachi]|uniref:hypothetical protein n=1 Tax=Jeongeupia wiesaeckerbachi TaxID=3051218 RepID=UPI003D806615